MIIFCDMIDNLQDKEKFELIYAMYKSSMYHLAYSITKDKCDAEDVLQISLVKLIGVLYKIQKEEIVESGCKGLLTTITRNTALDYLRRRKHIPVPMENLDNIKSPSTEDMYMRAEEIKLVVKCINELPQNYKDVIRLRTLFQISARETAGILDTNEANINTMLSRARKQLMDKLEAYRSGT